MIRHGYKVEVIWSVCGNGRKNKINFKKVLTLY